jgi:hypothetical protein
MSAPRATGSALALNNSNDILDRRKRQAVDLAHDLCANRVIATLCAGGLQDRYQKFATRIFGMGCDVWRNATHHKVAGG